MYDIQHHLHVPIIHASASEGTFLILKSISYAAIIKKLLPSFYPFFRAEKYFHTFPCLLLNISFHTYNKGSENGDVFVLNFIYVIGTRIIVIKIMKTIFFAVIVETDVTFHSTLP